MKIIERSYIDIGRWNHLVTTTENASVFSYSWYLDATAENWCALVNDDYTKGIALPYSVRLGVKTLYTPIFVRYIEWLGSEIDTSIINDAIKNHFSNIEVSIKQPLLGDRFKSFFYQTIPSNIDREFGSQAKRSLKKAINNDIEVEKSKDYSGVESIIVSELVGKYNGIDEVSVKALSKLFEAAKIEQRISIYEIKGHGGIVCITDEGTNLYLKGTVSSACKLVGGMYACLDYAINETIIDDKTFDFGGSRIDGVKHFNHNLGGKDVIYFEYTFDNGPIWFKLARIINNKWSKK